MEYQHPEVAELKVASPTLHGKMLTLQWASFNHAELECADAKSALLQGDGQRMQETEDVYARALDEIACAMNMPLGSAARFHASECDRRRRCAALPFCGLSLTVPFSYGFSFGVFWSFSFAFIAPVVYSCASFIGHFAFWSASKYGNTPGSTCGAEEDTFWMACACLLFLAGATTAMDCVAGSLCVLSFFFSPSPPKKNLFPVGSGRRVSFNVSLREAAAESSQPLSEGGCRGFSVTLRR